VTFDETAPCSHDVFECAGDKDIEERIFVDKELQGFDGDEDDPLRPSTSSPEPVFASTFGADAPQATTSSTTTVEASRVEGEIISESGAPAQNRQLRFGVLGLKITVMVFWFGPQNRQIQFGDLDIKVTATVSCFGHQNQSGFGLSVASQNQWREVGAGHASRSSRLLRHEVSLASFPVWPQDWRRCDDGWCTWHHRGGCVK
jgi:hypothetical protein